MTTSVWIGKLLECPVTIQAEWEDQTGNIRREVFTQRASATMFLRTRHFPVGSSLSVDKYFYIRPLTHKNIEITLNLIRVRLPI